MLMRNSKREKQTMRKLQDPNNDLTRDFRNRWLIRWQRNRQGELVMYLLAASDHRKSRTYIRAYDGSNIQLTSRNSKQ